MISTIASALIPATTISTTIDSSWNSTTALITTALNTSQYLFYTPSAASSIGVQNITTTRHSGTSVGTAGESGVIDLQTLDDIFNFNLNTNGTSIPPGASVTGAASNNGSNSGYYPVFPTYIRNTSMVFCVIIMCLGVIGNVMVPIVILKTKDMRNSTNIFLVNLSVADLLVLLVCTPTVLVEVNSRPETWVLGEEMCKAVPFVELTVAHASVLTILAISFERYYAICEPLKAGYVCTKTRASLICLLAWFFAAVFTSPILTFTQYRLEEYIDGTMVPVCWTSAESFWTAFFFVTIILLFFFIPLAILMILYTIIARTLMEHPSILLHTSKNNNVPSHTTLIYRKQVVLMLGTVVLAFFICLLPFRAFTLWIIIVPPEKLVALGIEGYYYLLFFCRIMFHINSAINPILYNLMSSKFRDGFLKLCGMKKRKIKRFIIRRSDHSKLDRKNTYTNTSISNSTTHTHCTDSFWRRYSSRNASEKSFRGATTTTTTINSGTPIRKNLDATNNCSSLSVSHGGSPIVGFSGLGINDNNTEIRRTSSFVRKSDSLLGKRFGGAKMEESYV